MESFATTPGLLVVRVTPGFVSSFTLYDGGRVDQVTGPEGARLTFTPGRILDGAVVYPIAGRSSTDASTTIAGLAVASQAAVVEADALSGCGKAAFDPGACLLRVAVGAGSHTVFVNAS